MLRSGRNRDPDGDLRDTHRLYPLKPININSSDIASVITGLGSLSCYDSAKIQFEARIKLCFIPFVIFKLDITLF